MRVRVCDVDETLLNVRRVTQAGNRIVFEENKGYIANKHSGERMWFRETDGVYLLSLWLRKGK